MLTIELRTLLTFFAAYFASVFVIPKLANIARTIGLVDQPDKRKVHKVPRPLVGGIGMVIAATFSCMLFVQWEGFRGLFLGLALLLFIGFLDDFRELGPKRKFLAQIGAAVLMMYFSKAYLASFGDLLGFGDLVLPPIDPLIWLVTIFCVVGVINSINLIDGLDGLAGGVSFIAFLTFGLHALFAGYYGLMLLNTAFAGAILGFLRFNWHPSLVFMGDAGSLSLGFVLAFMSVIMSQGEGAVIPPVVPLLVLAVPITDTVTVMSKRMIRGQNPFKPDRYHLHHILMRYGMSRSMAVKTILSICSLFSGMTLLLPFIAIPEWVLFSIYVIYLAGIVISSFFIVVTMKLSLKYKKRLAIDTGANYMSHFVRGFLHRVDLLKLFRNEPRFVVCLDMTLEAEGSDRTYNGELVNITRRGCMARVNDLRKLQKVVTIAFTLPIDNRVHILKLSAEHLWLNNSGNGYHHGFRFHGVTSADQAVLDEFMERFDRHMIYAEALN